MFRGLLRCLIAAAIGTSLVGCAEFTNRGGVVDKLEDVILFRANSKSHRVLRSYVMAGSLISLAKRGGIPHNDFPSLALRVNTTLKLSREAFICAYETHNGCVFFDEKMARLDSSIYRLALLVLFDSETKDFINEIGDKLSEDIPVFVPAMRSAVNAAKTVESLALTAAQSAQVVESLLRLSYRGLTKVARITPLYRDAMELDLVVIVDYWARRCSAQISSERLSRYALYDKLTRGYSRADLERLNGCADFALAYELYSEGNGDLRAWIAYIQRLNGATNYITPTADHFIAVSRMIWSACTALNNRTHIEKCRGIPDFDTLDVQEPSRGNKPPAQVNARMAVTPPPGTTAPGAAAYRDYYLLFAEYVARNEPVYEQRAHDMAVYLSRGLKPIDKPKDNPLDPDVPLEITGGNK